MDDIHLFPQEHCLYCHEIIYPVTGWNAVFSKEKKRHLCSVCEGKLEKIDGETCQICCRPFRDIKAEFRNGDLCHDCLRWEKDEEWRGNLEQNDSFFLYNDFLKEVMARYKFRGDYCLSKIFAEHMQKFLQNANADFIVPIPLSEERLYERGFNQAEALIRESGFCPSGFLKRTHSEKQSKKTRLERIHNQQVFTLRSIMDLTGKNILLVDDIYTTGSTLRHAAKVLKEAGAGKVRSITVAR